MQSRTRVYVIASLCLVALLITIWFAVRRDASTGGEHPSIGLNTTWPASTRSSSADISPRPYPTPLPAHIIEGKKVVEMALRPFQGASRATLDECGEAVESEALSTCIAPFSVQHVSFPQWEELFPGASFYVVRLVRRDIDPELTGHTQWKLGVWYDNQFYSASSFDRLLTAFGVTIHDDNKELVAQAFALMTLPAHATHNILFNKWEAGDWPGLHHYTHRLNAWTQLQGMDVWWYFEFRDDQLRIATRNGVADVGIGDYIGEIEWEFADPQIPITFQDYKFND